MRGRRSRARKTAAKEEPIVRVAPTRRSRTKVRRPSPPVTPRKRAVAPRVETPKPVARRKPALPKPVARRKPAPKPVARRKPTPKPVARKKPTRSISPSLGIATSRPTRRPVTKEIQRLSQIKPITNQRPVKKPRPISRPRPTIRPVKPKPPTLRKPAVQPIRKKPTPKPVASKRPTEPKIPESVQKRIEEMIASGRMKAPAPKKPAPKKTVAKKKPVPPKVTRPKPVARRKPAVQPVRKPKPPELTPEIQRRIQESLADLNIGGSRQPKRRAAPKPPSKSKITPYKTVVKKAVPKKTVAKKTAAKKKLQTTTGSFGGTGIVMSESARKKQEAIKNSPLYSEVQSANRALNKYVKEKHGNSENSAQSDPVYQKMVKDLFALQDRAAGAFSSQSTAPQAPTPPATQQQTGGGSFESDYIDWLESRPTPPRRPKGMGAASKSYQAKRKKYESDKAKWDASKPSRATYTPPVTTAPTAPTAPVVQPDYVPPPPGEAPDKFAGRYVPPTSILGTPDMSISSNIVGQSFDPSFAASFTPPPQPPGSTFGGYGQQAPMAALAPYAGMAQANPQPTDFFPTYIPRPEPIYETVQRPEPNRPTPRPDARPVMGGPGFEFNIDRGFGRGNDRINLGELTQYR